MASPAWAVNVVGWALSGLMAWALPAAISNGPFATRIRVLLWGYGFASSSSSRGSPSTRPLLDPSGGAPFRRSVRR
jgi:hypothetical protein